MNAGGCSGVLDAKRIPKGPKVILLWPPIAHQWMSLFAQIGVRCHVPAHSLAGALNLSVIQLVAVDFGLKICIT